MSRTTSMASWKWVLLLVELVLFAVILILPQVDLPDFTFHGGTAPVAAKARISSAPLQMMIRALPGTVTTMSSAAFAYDLGASEPVANHSAQLSFLCILLC